jgi:hypothetical protein
MSNGNWVKTFISTKSQVNLTIIPVGDGVTEVTVATIIGGKLMAKDLYTGKDLEKAHEAFDNFNRHESESFTEDCMKGNVEEAAPDSKENTEKVIDELNSDPNVKSYEMKDEDGNVIVSKDKESDGSDNELHGPGPDSKEGDSKEVETPVENPDAGKTKG